MMFLCLFDQTLHVLHVAKKRIDILIIGNIVSIVALRRSAHRGKPDCINAKLLQIIEFFYNTAQISDPIAIAVFKATRIDLVYHCFFPPVFFLHTVLPFVFRFFSCFFSPILIGFALSVNLSLLFQIGKKRFASGHNITVGLIKAVRIPRIHNRTILPCIG